MNAPTIASTGTSDCTGVSTSASSSTVTGHASQTSREGLLPYAAARAVPSVPAALVASAASCLGAMSWHSTDHAVPMLARCWGRHLGR